MVTLKSVDLTKQAIVTRYMGCTNHKPARVCAVSGNGRNRLTISYDDGLDTPHAHFKAAQALAAKLGWVGEMVRGAIPNGYAFVFVE